MRIVRLTGREAVEHALLEEFTNVVRRRRVALIGFATGRTFTSFFARLSAAIAAREVDVSELRATHLDEYLGFDVDQPGGMVHELTRDCPPLAGLLAEGRFWPVPSSGDVAAIAAHERLLFEAGNVDLQFLGIGRNGHIGFNEPGTPFDMGLHRVRLAASTRADARTRFAPSEAPYEAVTAGPRTILRARRVVLAATGTAKAAAVRAMVEGPIDPSCPASCLRHHADALVLLDAEAASELGSEGTLNAT